MNPRSVFSSPHPKRLSLVFPPPQRTLAQFVRAPHGDFARCKRNFHVTCALVNKGRRLSASDLEVRRIMGEGSYGQVFEGALTTNNGSERIVLKRVKPRVEGAAEMNEMEHLLNVYASKAAKNSVAEFIGYCNVGYEEASRNLTEGLWLIWRYEGSKTLSYYLKRRDCLSTIAADMEIPEDVVVPTVMKQIFENLQALHSAGLVHRDVKPLNIIYAERQRRFKLIDLGACADLRTGTNYVPDESILDPNYCPPEQYCLPTDAPHLAKMNGAVSIAFSPVLWSRHRPDRFDSYSAGLVLMQLAVPKLRTSSGLRVFNAAIKRHDYDLFKWRENERLPARETAILDANDGLGWKLAESLLRPRKVEVGDDGSVRFVEDKGARRLPIIGALRHPFLQQAVQPVAERASGGLLWGSSRTTTEPASSGGGVLDKALDIWHTTRDKLLDIEAKMVVQGEAIETQTTKVSKLRREVEAGKSRMEALEKERARLVAMEAQLQEQAKEFDTEASGAASLLHSIFGIKRSGTGSSSSQDKTGEVKEQQSGSSGKSAAKNGASDATAAAPLTGADRAPAQSLLGSLFGWKGSGTSEKPTSNAQPVVVEGKPTSTSLSTKGATESETSEVVPSGSAGESNLLADVAVNSLYTGLKFTGLALKVATGLAQVITKDAEKAFSANETTPQIKRVSRQASVAFMDMLRKLESPSITSTSKWADVAPRVADDERCIAVPEAARELMFETYVEAVAKLEKARTAKAEEAFKGLLLEAGVTAQTRWADLRAQLESQERFQAMPTEEARQRVFDGVVTQLLAEDGFRAMLEELDPPIRGNASWGGVRRRVWRDRRHEAVPEARRKQIFEEYRAVVQDFELYKASLASVDEEEETNDEPQPPGVKGMAIAAAAIEEDTGAQEAANAANLEALKEQQEHLRQEYARMRSKLLELEMEMKVKDALVETLDSDDYVNTKIQSVDEESAIIFRFTGQEKAVASPGKNGKTPAQNGKKQ
eukprot:jgi/Botrbrau1/10582/Bobra.0358s0005.1